MEKDSNAAKSRILLGTSGWSYKEWENIFYPDSKTPKLTYYSGVFPTAEIDSTFYAYPNKSLVHGWVRNTPAGFEFAAKIPKLITHDKKLDLEKGVEVDLVKFLDVLSPLKDSKKLGPLLIQLPPSFSKNHVDNLKNFFEILPTDLRFAVEFRNESWLTDRESTYSLLEKFNIATTIIDEPLLPVDLKTTSDFAFVRWHGKGKRLWYNYHYSEEELDPWVPKVEEVAKKVKKVYGYFNNHFNGAAAENALTFLAKMNMASEKQKKILSGMLDRRESYTREKTEQRAQMKLV